MWDAVQVGVVGVFLVFLVGTFVFWCFWIWFSCDDDLLCVCKFGYLRVFVF